MKPYLMSNFPSVRPSLNLQFDSQPTPADMTSHLASVGATFSRASIGTYVDANGVIQEATAGQARPNYSSAGVHEGLLIEEARTNLIKSSEDFSANIWTTSNSSVTVNQAISPSDDASADKVTKTPNDENDRIKDTISISNSTDYTISIFLKNDDVSQYTTIGVRISGGTLFRKTIDWDSSATPTLDTSYDSGSPSDAFLQDYGNGWYRFGFTFTSDGTSGTFELDIDRGATGRDEASSLYLWGAQLEAGSFPTSYIPTIPTFTSRASDGTYFDSSGVLQTASTDEERIDHKYIDGEWVEAGLLLEGASTNLVTDSEDFDASSWTKFNSPTITVNDSVAPDGTTTADLLTNADSGINKRIEDSMTVSDDFDNYCASLFIKKELSEAYTLVQLVFQGGIAINYAIRIRKDTGDFTDEGTAFSGLGADAIDLGVEDYGDYWRLFIVGANNGKGNTTALFRIFIAVTSSNGINSGSATVWGAQLEEQSQPTSYIATSGSTVTRSADVYTTATKARSADVCYIDGTAFTDFYNQEEGTFFVFWEGLTNGSDQDRWIGVHDSSKETATDDRIIFALGQSSNTIRLFIQDDGAILVSSIDNTSVNHRTPNKYALAVKLNDVNSYHDGVQVHSDTSVTMPSADKLVFHNGSGSRQYIGYIRKLIYFPRRLSDNELIKLTQ